MRVKRCLAFFLALIMLISENVQAFAYNGSDSDAVPFVVSEEDTLNDVSEAEDFEISGNSVSDQSFFDISASEEIYEEPESVIADSEPLLGASNTDQYEAIIDPNTGRPYDLGGITVTIRDWFSPDNFEEPSDPQSDYEEARAEYREWIQDTYNFRVHTVTMDNWGSGSQNFIDYVDRGGDNNNFIWTIHSGDKNLLYAAKTGYCYDLSTLDCLDFTDSKYAQNSTHEIYSFNGGIYGMHAGPSEPRVGVYFNKRLLEEVHIDPDSIYDMQKNGTWTWEAFENILEAVQRDTDGDGTIDVWGLCANESVSTSAAVFSNGGKFVGRDSDGNYTYEIESAESVEALEWILGIYQKYDWNGPVADDGTGPSWDYFEGQFQNGGAVFCIEQQYAATPGNFFADMTDELGFVMFPKGPSGNLIQVSQDNVYVIPGCYSAQKAWNCAFAFDVWNAPVPGFEDHNPFTDDASEGNFDERALSETIPLMGVNTTVNFADSIENSGEFMNGPLFWAIGPDTTQTISEILEEVRTIAQNYINIENSNDALLSYTSAEINKEYSGKEIRLKIADAKEGEKYRFDLRSEGDNSVTIIQNEVTSAGILKQIASTSGGYYYEQEHFPFTPKKDGDYYIVFKSNDSKPFSVTMTKSWVVESLRLLTQPKDTEFYYGIEDVNNSSFHGLSIEATKADGSKETYTVIGRWQGNGIALNSDFFSFDLYDPISDPDFKKPIKRDKYYCYPEGNYTARIKIDSGYVDIPITIVPLTNVPKIGYDEAQKLHVMPEIEYYDNSYNSIPKWLCIDVSAGELLKLKTNINNGYGYINQILYFGEDYKEYLSGDRDYSYTGGVLSFSVPDDFNGTFYISWAAYQDFDVYAENIEPITGISIVKEPDNTNRYYAYFAGGPYLHGIRLKLTYEDGTEEFIGYDQLADKGIVSALYDSENNIANSKPIRYESGYEYYYPAGIYHMVLAQKNISCSYDITIHAWDDIPEIKKDPDRPVHVPKTNMNYQGKGYDIATDYFRTEELVPGDYVLRGTGPFEVRIYDETGKRIYENNNSAEEQYFTINEAGRYYIGLFWVFNDITVTLEDGNKPVSISLYSKPIKTSFTYGFEWPSINGAKYKITFKDKTSKIVSADDTLVISQLMYSNGQSAYNVRDIYGNNPVGSYYWLVYLKADRSKQITIPCTITPINPKTTLNPGSVTATLSNNMYKTQWGYSTWNDKTQTSMTPYYIACNLVEGETYLFGYNAVSGSISLYDPGANQLVREQDAFYYKAEKTGIYYLKTYISGGTVFCENTAEILSVKVINPMRNSVKAAGTYDWLNFKSAGLTLELTLKNGEETETIETEFGDETWKSYGISVGWFYSDDIYGASGYLFYINPNGSYKPRGDKITLEAGSDYYGKIIIPGYNGEIIDEDKVKITAKSKEELSLRVGERRDIPKNEDGYLVGSDAYYLYAEEGKTYRVSFGNSADIWDHWYGLEYGKERYDSESAVTLNDIDYSTSRYFWIDDKIVITAEQDELYVFLLNEFAGQDDLYIYVEEIPTPTGEVLFYMDHAYDTRKYKYGVEDLAPKGITLTIKGKSADRDVSFGDFAQEKIYWSVFKKDSKGKVVEAPIDNTYNIPVGNDYFYGYYIIGISDRLIDGEEVGYIYDETHIFSIVNCRKSYTVEFNSNYKDETLKPAAKTQTINNNKLTALQANAFKEAGYKFVGWALSPDGEVEYEDKAQVYNLSFDILEDDSATVKLYAIWEIEDYSINWHLAGGEFTEAKTVSYTINDEVALPEAADFEPITGFEFDGWYLTADYKKPAASITKGSTGNKDFYAKWKPITYTIKFSNVNGNDNGKSTMKDMLNVRYGIIETIPANTYKDTRAFMGWALEPDGELVFDNKGTIDISQPNIWPKVNKVENELYLYAVWQESFDVVLDYDGGTYTPNAKTSEIITGATKFKDDNDDRWKERTYYNYGDTIALPILSKEGYSFLGWYKGTADDCVFDSKAKITSISKTMAENLYLYAYFVPMSYTIRFDANGGSGKMANLGMTYDDHENLPVNAYTRAGYEFKGWVNADANTKKRAAALTEAEYLEFKNSNTIYENASEVNLIPSKNKVTVTLCAVWEAKTLTVEYNTNGGNSISPTTFTVIKAENLPANTKTETNVFREGYDFAGWYKEATFKTKVTTTKGFTDNVTLYAKWTAKYTIVFDGSGATSGTMTPQANVNFGTATAIKANAFKKDGNAFVGWAIDPDATKDTVGLYADKEKIFGDKIALEDGKLVLKLYAVWSDTFSITYEDDAEYDLADDAPVEYHYGTEPGLVLPNPEKDNYIFDGWYTDAAFKKKLGLNKDKQYIIPKTMSGDVDLYAKWKGQSYTVIFDANVPEDIKVTGKTANEVMVYGAGKALTVNGYKRTDAVFVGWAATPNGDIVYADKAIFTGEDYQLKDCSKDAKGNATITLYAKWRSDYNITFHTEGGFMAEDTDMHYSYGNEVALPTPIRDGYTFAGWFKEETFKTKLAKITKTTSGDFDLYAKWTGMKYTISFDANVPEDAPVKVTGKTANAAMTYGTAKAITKNSFKLAGYHFTGWATRPDGAVVYADAAKISDRYSAETGIVSIGKYSSKVTLYAVWEMDAPYTVSYDMGGIVEPDYYGDNITYTYTVKTGYPLPAEPSKLGYTFLGFYTDKACRKKATDLKVGTTGDITFYAKWQANK